MTRFRRIRRWWMRQHNYSRCWPWCWDCRCAQKAWAKGEFYAHDDPRWYINEILSRPQNVMIVPPPTGPSITIAPPDWKPAPTSKTQVLSYSKVWIR